MFAHTTAHCGLPRRLRRSASRNAVAQVTRVTLCAMSGTALGHPRVSMCTRRRRTTARTRFGRSCWSGRRRWGRPTAPARCVRARVLFAYEWVCECVVSSPVLRVGVVDVLLLLNAPCCDTVALTSPCVRAPQAEAKSAAEAKAATEKAAATAAAAAAATVAPAAAEAAKV